MSDGVSAARVFGAILLRDVTVARRELPYFLVRTTLQPILFVIVFGFLLPRMGLISHGYTTMMMPGIVALSLTLSAIQSVALPMMADFGFTKEIEDRLLAPIPTPLVAIEKVVSGVLQGVVAAAFVLPICRLVMGPIPGLTFSKLPLLMLVTVLSGAAFSAIGLYLGTAIPPQQIGLMFSVILAPDHVRLHVLPVDRAATYSGDEVRRADQPARLCFRGDARSADALGAAHADAGAPGRFVDDAHTFHVARFARFRPQSHQLTSVAIPLGPTNGLRLILTDGLDTASGVDCRLPAMVIWLSPRLPDKRGETC